MTPRLSKLRHHLRADLLRRIEERPIVAILDELDGAKHPLPADIADIGMVAERLSHRLPQIAADLAGIVDQAQLVDQLQVRDPRRRADRVGGVSPAMADRAELVRARFENLPDLL